MTPEELTEWRKNLKPGDKVWAQSNAGPATGDVYAILPQRPGQISTTICFAEEDVPYGIGIFSVCAYPSLNECLMAHYTEKSRFLYEKFQEGLRSLSESLSIQHEMNRLVEEDFRNWEKFHNERKP